MFSRKKKLNSCTDNKLAPSLTLLICTSNETSDLSLPASSPYAQSASKVSRKNPCTHCIPNKLKDVDIDMDHEAGQDHKRITECLSMKRRDDAQAGGRIEA